MAMTAKSDIIYIHDDSKIANYAVIIVIIVTSKCIALWGEPEIYSI